MRWCRIELAGRPTYGLIEDEQVATVTGDPFAGYERTGQQYPLADVKLLAPVIPPTFYAAGTNYKEHILEMAAIGAVPAKFPAAADVGYRAVNAIIAHDEPIIVPKDAGEEVQYEGELVVVIGKQCRRVSEAEALDYVLGYTLGNDMSERGWQRQDRTLWRAKNTDTFNPMGPWIVTDLEPDDLHVTIRLNGQHMYTYRVGDALFTVRHFLSRMSQYLTLYPGDVLWMGTDGPTPNLKDGDVVEIDVPAIGVLRNRIVRER